MTDRIVQCVDNQKGQNFLTIGMFYDAEFKDGKYYILNDHHEISRYNVKEFVTLDELIKEL